MVEITTRSSFTVELIDHMGNDEAICQAARVSTLGSASIETMESKGLINFLLSNRHGTPFEHTAMKFRIEAPIFVWREFMRHRVGFSYNEESGRYKKLDPVFYVPPVNRPLVQQGKPGHYEFVPGTHEQMLMTHEDLIEAYQLAWDNYEGLLDKGIAKEVSRMCLPVATYSSAYVTCNARSIMAFLSLRTKHENAKFPSYPQHEIDCVATAMEVEFDRLFPLTSEAFTKHGRVHP